MPKYLHLYISFYHVGKMRITPTIKNNFRDNLLQLPSIDFDTAQLGNMMLNYNLIADMLKLELIADLRVYAVSKFGI